MDGRNLRKGGMRRGGRLQRSEKVVTRGEMSEDDPHLVLADAIRQRLGKD